MKKLLLLIVSLFISAQSFAQDPDLYRTWFLREVQASDENDIYVVADIDPVIQPWLTISETLEFNGEGACNTFMGTFSYDSPIFQSTDFTESADDCNSQTHNFFETDYFDFIQFFGPASITPDSNGLTLYIDHPLMGYAIFKDYSLSINENDFDNSITVYPNPVSDQLFITSENLQIEKISIYSMSGKEVQRLETKEKSIDVSNLSEGIYFIEITSQEGKSVQKFIKQ